LQTIEGVAELSLIQGVIPDRVLGRVNATLDVVAHGLGYPLGALVAAVVAEQIGVRGAIAVGWAGMALSIAWVVFSPVPRLRAASDVVGTELAGAAPTSAPCLVWWSRLPCPRSPSADRLPQRCPAPCCGEAASRFPAPEAPFQTVPSAGRG